MGIVSRTFRHTKRYQEIAAVLVRYGMGDFLHSMKVAETFPFLKKVIPKRSDRSVSDFTRWENIRMAVEELGPTFVKLGQMLSNRPDLLPAGLLEEFVKLQDKVPSFSAEEAIIMVEKELGKPVGELFADFEHKPVASASIGQVHRATFFDGTKVAVKVQRPDIENVISVDLEILHSLAKLAENNIKQFRYLNPTGIMVEFERSIRREMDYNRERSNLERFHRIFKDDKRVFVPIAHKGHSSKRVFTMDYVEGVKITDIVTKDLQGYDRKLVATRGAELMMTQVFIKGFFHADPHPGNLWVLDNNVLCFLDFGMMGSITPAQQEVLGSMLIALVKRDAAMVTNLMLDMTKNPEHPRAAEIEFEVHDMLDKYMDLPLEELNVAEILQQLIQLLWQFKLKVPASLAMIAKAMLTVEGIGQTLYPQFQLSVEIDKFSMQILRHRLDPKKFFSETLTSLNDFKKLFYDFPADFHVILQNMKRGKFKSEFEHKGLEPMQETLNAASYRILFGLVLAALIVGSSIMVHVDAPKWDMIPAIGFAGFTLGAASSVVILAVAVIRSFRRK